MDRLEEFNAMTATRPRPSTARTQGRRTSQTASSPVLLEDVQRDQGELFAWLTDYHHAVVQGASRSYLLAIFDAMLDCVRKHFRAVEAVLEQRPGSRFQQYQGIHGEITDALEAHRAKLAGPAPLDDAEGAHAIDVMLVQCGREQPLFGRRSRGAAWRP